ncbi:LacI family DNA-binding transcriptional regulator [Alteribacillus sp. HJP-4]|uniref:LacI family DNA-binding transcriptional regulator n=1 Tax=Alteribacillus sp. HJP-4 TaxID=2775394 RepID=UPI0035CCF96E
MLTIRKVTLQDVADHAAVSKSTVSQYLNGRYTYMGENTKKRIQHAIQELKYQPNAIARSLKQKKTTTIGVILANILHRFSTQTSRAIEDFCHKHSYHVILCNADDDPLKEQSYIEMLKAKQVDGFIIVPTAFNEEMYKHLLDERYPLVFLDRKMKALPVPTISLKNEKAALKAVSHLIENGHKTIAYVSSAVTISPRSERFTGFETGMKKAGLPINQSFVYTGNLDEAAAFYDHVFAGSRQPDAILTGNDRALMKTLSYLKNRFNNIPDTLSLLTFDDVEFAEFYSPSITTLEQPAYDMGTKAAEVLMSQIKGGENMENTETTDYCFEGILKIRESSQKRGGEK